MKVSFASVAALVACVLAGAALAVSLAHAGPRGPAGPQGPPGKAISVQQARYGVCWTYSMFTQNWSDGSSSTWVNGVNIEPPQISSGVYQCPQGETFVTIQPLPAGG